MRMCRLCGETPVLIGSEVECVNPQCRLYRKLMPLTEWDSLGLHTSLRHLLSCVTLLGIAAVIICSDVEVAQALRMLFFCGVVSLLLMELAYEYL